MNSLRMLLVSSMFLFIAGCSGNQPVVKPSESISDTPVNQVLMGYRFLENHEYDKARLNFENALRLNPSYYPALNGLAELYLALSQTDLALQFTDRSYRIYAKSDTIMALKYYVSFLNSVNDESINKLRELQQENPASPYISYFLMLALRDAALFEEAERLSRTIPAGFKDTQQESKILFLVSSSLKQKPAEILKYGAKKTVTRAELAAITSYFFSPMQKTFKMRLESEAPAQCDFIATDVDSDHWALSFIKEVMECRGTSTGMLRLMDYSDPKIFRFAPDKQVTKLELSHLLQNCIILKENNFRLASQFICDGVSIYRDVPCDDPVYNAAVLSVKYGILEVQPNGSFGSAVSITGYDCLKAFAKLEDMFKSH